MGNDTVKRIRRIIGGALMFLSHAILVHEPPLTHSDHFRKDR